MTTKRLRNKIAGYTTRLMKRIQRGPVRGISFRLQEEERERRDNYVPERSALDVEEVMIDQDTSDLLASLDCGRVAGLRVVDMIGRENEKPRRRQF